jgi:hypothetical protein
LDLCSQKIGEGHSIIKESITTPEAAIQAEGEAGVDSRIDLYIICITREIRIKGEGTIPSSLNPRKR